MAKAKTPGGRRMTGTKVAPAGQTVTVDAPVVKKPRPTIPQFFSQVRAEGRKIVWPSRKETWITSVMVFIMVVIAAIFFAIVDGCLTVASKFILALGQ